MVALRARLLRVEDTRRDEPALLDSLLATGDPALRRSAALAAGRIGARAHRPGIRSLVGDRDPSVASAALFALAMLRDTAAVPLAVASLHGDAAVAREGAALLGALGDPARAALVSALADPSLASGVRGDLLLAASRLRPLPVDAVRPWIASPDTAIAWRAAYAVARARAPGGVRALLDAATSPAAMVREQVARGLARSATGDTLNEPAIARLLVLVRDPAPRVRVNALRALATHGWRARGALRAALRDSDGGVRRAAAESFLPAMDSTEAAWALAASVDSSFLLLRPIVEGASRQGIVLPVVAEWSRSDDWARRAAAVEAEAVARRADALPRLLAASGDRDARVRAAAYGAAANLLGGRDSAIVRTRVRALLRGALADADFVVRAAALSALAARADADDLAAALDAADRIRADADNDARLAFWTLIDSATRRIAPLSAELDARVARLPRPDDPLERAAAARIARFASWRGDAGTARPFAWYEERVRESLARPRPVARIETAVGVMELELFALDAPLTVYNFTSLAARGYFDGQRFHRVVPNFVVQAGDPRGDGNGGPGYAIRDEINPHRYDRGTLGMALSGPDTGGSQFFITHSPQPHLDGGYTVFGQLRSGGETLDRIVQGDRIDRITVQ